jgi:NosR/NirI family transcriptional regulator, nitrous oxide reductase regulator
MKRKAQFFTLMLVISLLAYNVLAIQRFPKPEFESGYTIPHTQVTRVQHVIFEYMDLVVFIGCMSLITWIILKKRSRRAVFWISVFSLLYFGFYRKGCICPVGSLQNITMALFNPHYNIPVTAIAFFVIPLGFTLFFGRTFCAGVCPLGAIQDLFALRPVSLKPWIRYLLGLIPFIYLGLAVLYAATGTDFIICRYDPFVGFFRHNGTSLMFVIGGVLLLTGIFIARPYCRFFCPYGVLLNLVSRVSRRHLSIADGKCINCKLCENACPYDAIDKPTGLGVKNDNRELVKKLIVYGLITPVLVVLTGWTVSKYHAGFSHVNFKVRLAEEMMTQSANAETGIVPVEVTTFRSSGVPAENLYKEAAAIVQKFYTGSWIIGCFIGLVFGLTLARLTIFRYRNEYLANKGNCYSCARCLEYCPVKKGAGTGD